MLIHSLNVSSLLPPREIFPFSYIVVKEVSCVKPDQTLLRRGCVSLVSFFNTSGDINSPMM